MVTKDTTSWWTLTIPMWENSELSKNLMMAPELVAPENRTKSPVWSSGAMEPRGCVSTSGGERIPSLHETSNSHKMILQQLSLAQLLCAYKMHWQELVNTHNTHPGSTKCPLAGFHTGFFTFWGGGRSSSIPY